MPEVQDYTVMPPVKCIYLGCDKVISKNGKPFFKHYAKIAGERKNFTTFEEVKALKDQEGAVVELTLVLKGEYTNLSKFDGVKVLVNAPKV